MSNVFRDSVFPNSGIVEEGKLMTKETLKTFSLLSGLFLIFLIIPQGTPASSSALTSIEYPIMTAAGHQDLNAGGQIVENYLNNSENPTDLFHGILATPVPELVAMLLLGFVLNGLWGVPES